MLKLGAEGAGRMYINDVGHRFLELGWFIFSTHLIEYPFEILVCLLPWSGLLIVWCNTRFRRTLGQARTHAVFLMLCLAIPFPTVWLPPGSRPRYFMCLYPCVALLAAIAADRVSRTRNSEKWRIVWPIFVRAWALAIAVVGLLVLVVALGDFKTWLKQPKDLAALYALVSLAVAGVAWWAAAAQSGLRRRAAVLAIAAFVALSYDTIMINAFRGTTVDTAGAVARLKQRLPANSKLVSFGPTHHMFAFYYHDHIPVCPWPETIDEVDAGVRYFLVEPGQVNRTPLPFLWEVVDDISCDRHQEQAGKWRVIVGRRTDPAATHQTSVAGAGAQRSPGG